MKKLGAILLCALVIAGCKKDEDEINPVVNTYPLEIGNKWEYTLESFGYVYENGTSNNIIDTIEFSRNTEVIVEKDTVLSDTLMVKKIVEYYSTGGRSIYYVALSEEGLTYFAYALGEKGYDKIYKNENPTGQNNQKYLVRYYDDPLLDFKIPMQIGDQWEYFTSEVTSYSANKEVTGKSSISVGGQDIDCFKVETTYFNDGELDDTYWFTEWVSAIGRVKKVVNSEGILVMEDGSEYGYIKGETVTRLTSYTIN